MFIALIEHRVTHLAAACLLWWLLSGRADWLLLSLGLGSAAFSVYLARRMMFYDRESHPFVMSRKLLRYWLWLIGAIVKANWDVARRILSAPLDISPTWVRLYTSKKTDVGMVVLANSITLTPGTVSLDVEEGAITVHALTQEAAESLQTGDMDRRAPDPGRTPRPRR